MPVGLDQVICGAAFAAANVAVCEPALKPCVLAWDACKVTSPAPVSVTVFSAMVAGPETTLYAIDAGNVEVAVAWNGASPNSWFATLKVMLGTTSAGAVTVNGSEVEVPPPGAGFLTVTCASPCCSSKEAIMTACNSVLLTKVVTSPVPLNITVDDGKKLLPVTVSVRSALAAAP